MADKKKKNSFSKGISSYFREVTAELKKVVYPTASQVRTNTAIVLIMVLVVGSFIWALDWGFNKTVSAVINWGKGQNAEIPSNMSPEEIEEWLKQYQTTEDESLDEHLHDEDEGAPLIEEGEDNIDINDFPGGLSDDGRGSDEVTTEENTNPVTPQDQNEPEGNLAE